MNTEEEKNIQPADEENVVDAVVEEPNDDGFTDEIIKPAPVTENEENPSEEAKPAEEVLPEDAEVVEEPEVEIPETNYESEIYDPRFDAIENARKQWNGSYRKASRIRFVVNTVVLVAILAGWLVPTLTMKDAGMVPLYIGLACAGVGIAILLIYGHFNNKKNKEQIANYFNAYFTNINSYTLEDFGVKDIQGDVNSKITKEEFLESGVFDKIAAIGSRDNIVFNYKGMDCAMAEAAAQVDAGKSLATVFVGKYLRTHNEVEVSDEGLVIYFSGNDRALPPAKLKELHITETNSRYKVYGKSTDKKVLTKKVREALARIRTNSLLVDITIVIKSGRTYWYLGYEDDLMVLPNDKHFDSRYVREYKDQLELVLEASLLLNGHLHD